MFTITINAKTPDEFKEAIKELYFLFPDAPKKGKAESKQEAKQPETGNTKTDKPGEPPVDPIPASTSTPGITIESVRMAVQEKTTAKEENKAVIRTLLAGYNASSVTKLDPAHYAEFLTKVKAIA